ncbi:MAG TPA: hypothetical protein VEV17_25035, partial [Bryobacteraceae bacterium]|nr:hypothetical protein [Bryobacteraceae bacterium]
MTIALGVLSQSGIVIAADSQEGTGRSGDMKLSTTKISLASSVHWEGQSLVSRMIAITGAGEAGYLDAIKQNLVDAFNGSPNSSIAECQQILKQTIAAFYQDHIMPFKPSDWGNLEPDLIIGVCINNERRLWISDRTTLTRSDSVVAVGAGDSWARQAIKGFASPLADER